MDELSQRVQDLPPELFNMVLDYTTLTMDDEVVIAKDMKIPVGLHINRAVRAAIAEKFYRNTIFVLPTSSRPSDLRKWLESMSANHLRAIRTIRLERRYAFTAATLDWAIKNTVRSLFREGLMIERSVLYIQSSYKLRRSSTRVTEWLNSIELKRQIKWEIRNKQLYDAGAIVSPRAERERLHFSSWLQISSRRLVELNQIRAKSCELCLRTLVEISGQEYFRVRKSASDGPARLC